MSTDLTYPTGEEIKVESILESESNREAEQMKCNRVDLKCIDAKDQQIMIEIQNQRESIICNDCYGERRNDRGH